jgi:hypothetical protein
MNVFERYLSLWVAACMALGVVIGKTLPGIVGAVRDLQFGEGSQINIPIAILIWLMIYPMIPLGYRSDGPISDPVIQAIGIQEITGRKPSTAFMSPEGMVCFKVRQGVPPDPWAGKVRGRRSGLVPHPRPISVMARRAR